MKKVLVCLLIIMVIMASPLFLGFASAESLYDSAAAEFGSEKLDDELSKEEKIITGEFDARGNMDVSAALARLWKSFVSEICEEIKTNIHYFVSLAVLTLVCAMGAALCDSKEIQSYMELAACGFAANIVMGSVEGIISQTVDAMYRLSDYSKAALPVVFSAAAAGGAVSSAATKFAAVTFALDVIMSVSQKVIIPIVYSFLALSLANSMFPSAIVGAVQKICKWLTGTLMTGMTLAFTSYISMVGVIGAAVDTTAVKAARSFISGVLPVVGGMISDTSAMVLSAAGVIRNCAGVFGLLAVAAICAGPFAVLSVKMLLLKAVAATADSMQINRLSSLYSGFGTAMGILLGLLGSCGIMLFISLTAGMKAVII